MNNEKKENDNKLLQETIENQKKNQIYKINILASVEHSVENEKSKEIINSNIAKKNRLFLTPKKKRIKIKNRYYFCII